MHTFYFLWATDIYSKKFNEHVFHLLTRRIAHLLSSQFAGFFAGGLKCKDVRYDVFPLNASGSTQTGSSAASRADRVERHSHESRLFIFMALAWVRPSLFSPPLILGDLVVSVLSSGLCSFSAWTPTYYFRNHGWRPGGWCGRTAQYPFPSAHHCHWSARCHSCR